MNKIVLLLIAIAIIYWLSQKNNSIENVDSEENDDTKLVENMSNEKSEEITKQLLATGILIRQLHSYKLPNCLRISIGTNRT